MENMNSSGEGFGGANVNLYDTKKIATISIKGIQPFERTK